jgi:hypothetical protein
MAHMGPESQRPAIPLWCLPLLVLAAIIVILYLSYVIHPLALVPALVAVAWVERRADAYVRRMQS